MRFDHLRTTVWLRWRILANRIQRTGSFGNVLYAIVLVLSIGGAITSFALALILGLAKLGDAEPFDVMMTWVVLAGAFLFFWLIGLITDLQRGDSLSLENMLHLPVSLRWVFLCNYLGSFVSLSSLVFLPAMAGLSLAMTITSQGRLWITPVLVLAFFVLLTAVTYQLRGWLARLMKDKRRGRHIVAALTVGLILLVQIPNLMNLGSMRARKAERRREREEKALAAEELAEEAAPELLEVSGDRSEGGNAEELVVAGDSPAAADSSEESDASETDAKRLTPEEREARAAARKRIERRRAKKANIDRTTQRISAAVPFGWLPYGVRAALEGRHLVSLLCALGMFALGGLSLGTSYRSTVAGVTGAGRVRTRRRGAASAPRAASTPGKGLLLERQLPVVSEGVATVALGTLRSMLRSPEAKMVLLSPLILLVMAGMLFNSAGSVDHLKNYAQHVTVGAALLGPFSILQLIQNQFGLDRAGFRSYVLSPLSRRDVLVGKNLALAPLSIGVSLTALLLLRLFLPYGVEAFIGGVLQILSAYLLISLLGNLISIFGPMKLQEGGMRTTDVKLKTMLWQVAAMFVMPLAISPLLLPSLVVQVLNWTGHSTSLPIYATLQLLVFFAALAFYRYVVRGQGALLQEREQRILELLTGK